MCLNLILNFFKIMLYVLMCYFYIFMSTLRILMVVVLIIKIKTQLSLYYGSFPSCYNILMDNTFPNNSFSSIVRRFWKCEIHGSHFRAITNKMGVFQLVLNFLVCLSPLIDYACTRVYLAPYLCYFPLARWIPHCPWPILFYLCNQERHTHSGETHNEEGNI